MQYNLITQLPNWQEILSLLGVPVYFKTNIYIVDALHSKKLIMLNYINYTKELLCIKNIIIDNSDQASPRIFAESIPYIKEVCWPPSSPEYPRVDFDINAEFTNTDATSIIRFTYMHQDKKWYISTSKRIDISSYFSGEFPYDICINKNYSYTINYTSDQEYELLCIHTPSGNYMRRIPKRCTTFTSSINTREELANEVKDHPIVYFHPRYGRYIKFISPTSTNSIEQLEYLIERSENRLNMRNPYIEKDIQDLPLYIYECFQKKINSKSYTKFPPEEFYIISKIRIPNLEHISPIDIILHELKNSTPKQLNQMINHMHKSAKKDVN